MAEELATRYAYGAELARQGADKRIVVLDADLSSCTMSSDFAALYPERFFNVGIAEENMVGMAAGMATTGKIAFCHSFAMFASGRAYDQVRNSIAYPRLNVKVIGSHGGLSAGEDGGTHQCIEDFALMSAIPGMTVICPCDEHETEEAVKAITAYDGPVYMRTSRIATQKVTQNYKDYKYQIGKGVTLQDGTDVTIIATGIMVQEVLKATTILANKGISVRVIDMHTIKPLDIDLVIKAAKETGAIVTVEEHNRYGGLGASVAETIVQEYPVPMSIIAIDDKFGHSGNAYKLMEEYGLSADNIVAKTQEVLKKKG